MDIVITGGTSGIGYRIAKDLIAEGHQVIIIGQDAAKGRASVAQLAIIPLWLSDEIQ
ncbi:SDR family NAD(P)-dependent oxidoreductase [Latilactobacillus curvatus]|uniref:SDR family NAD(P)-dependent oxidoreductase n=1 Tax=Latilactobacillus curvatus TaxID=28038 RepID=UPI0020A2E9CD|nr:SDR family NAD(P)-dependent oxidoreductase [Latilactobacillus curvatus]